MNDGKKSGLIAAENTEETLDALEELENLCFSCPWKRSFFETPLRLKKLFYLPILYENGAPVGYAVLFTIFDEAELQNLAVHPAYRSAGRGRLILDRCLDEAKARGAKVMRLEVRKGNAAARALYEKAGFAVTGQRKNYYHSPVEDALLMEKIL